MAEVVCSALLGMPGSSGNVSRKCVVSISSRHFTGSWGCQLRTSTGPALPRLSVIEPSYLQLSKVIHIFPPDSTCCCRPSSAALCVATPVVERYLYTTIPGVYTTLCHGLVHCGEH